MPHRLLKGTALFLSLGLWGTIVWLELHTDIGLRMGPLYVLPAGLMGWYQARKTGALAAILLVTSWQVIDIRQAGAAVSVVEHLFNLVVRFISLVSVSLGASWARSALEREKVLSRELHAALERVQVLEGLLPICAWCKKVRNDQGTWEQIEAYVSEHSNATWTHGICPECKAKFQEGGPVVASDPGEAQP
jgi:hypothetical protein